MPDLLIEDLDPALIVRLEEQAGAMAVLLKKRSKGSSKPPPAAGPAEISLICSSE
jgi:hypothetical protein